MLRIIKDIVIANKIWKVSTPNNIQHKVEFILKKFDSYNFTMSWKARPTIQHHVGCIAPLKFTKTKFPRDRSQIKTYFQYSGRFHTEFLVAKHKSLLWSKMCISRHLRSFALTSSGTLCEGLLLFAIFEVAISWYPYVWISFMMIVSQSHWNHLNCIGIFHYTISFSVMNKLMSHIQF